MNSFDKIMESIDSEYMIAEEGSTKDAVQALNSEDFDKALSLMREGKKNKDPKCFRKAISLLKKVRKTISSTRTYPISFLVGNSIGGMLYALSTSKKVIATGLLYKDDETTAKLNTIIDAVTSIIGTVLPVSNKGIAVLRASNMISNAAQISRFIENKRNEPTQPAKFMNNVCARMIQFVDLYISSCEKYIADYSK